MEIRPESTPFYLDFLTKNERSRYNKLTHPAKKNEFASTRYLKHLLFGTCEIEYSPSGSPYIIGEKKYISISHSKTFVAIGVNPDFEIGIDLEEIREKAKLTASKFVTPVEAQLFDLNSTFETTLLWSFKEVLYKLSDRKELIFKRDLLVDRKDDSYVGRVLKSDGFYEFELCYAQHQNIFITCNASNETKIS
jgi:4'-phosphopantetheinyl transferase EntD